MKLLFLFCIVVSTSISASVWSQQRLTIRLGQTELKKVFEEIQRQTDKLVLYNDDLLGTEQKVKADFKDVELEKILKQVLEGRSVTYRLMDDYIVIAPLNKNEVQQQGKGQTIKGYVTDKNGDPLPGVTVLLKGTQIGMSTDVSGHFVMNLPEPRTAILVFSMVGMKQKEISVGDKTELEVVMEEETSDLDEVIVIGYGTSTKKDLTGSVARFDSKILEESTATNVAHMMQGQIPGLSILAGSGAPGSPAKLEIRGVPSLNGATSPLIVVNNVPMSQDFDINELNPSDIENIDVLKGASSTAIYGSRAAAGVIMITTKGGKRNQKPVVNYSFSYSLSSLVSDINTLTTDEFKMLLMEATRNEAKANGYVDITTYSNYKKFSDPAFFGEANTPWMKYIMQDGTQQQHRVSIRGGADAIGYNASFGYSTEVGQVKATKFDRYTYDVGFDGNINKWVKATVKASGTISERLSNGATLASAAEARPDIKAYNEDGSLYLHTYMYNGNLQYVKNPIIEMQENTTTDNNNSLRLMGNVEVTVLPELKLLAQYAWEDRKGENDNYASSRTYAGSNYWKGQKGAGKKSLKGVLLIMPAWGKCIA